MITKSENEILKHEAREWNKPWVLLRNIGVQSGSGNLPSVTLYNIVGGPAGVTMYSTVTAESMLRQGYRVEVVE